MTVQADTDLLGRYLAGDGPSNDEFVTPEGSIRPHWTAMLEGYRNLGDGELLRRADEIDLLLEQEGVTYNRVAADDEPPARPRPWALDPVPLLVPGDDWAGLERGVAQRAELLDAILADLYGPRRLLTDRLIPPAMILGDPQYLRAWHGVGASGPRHLPLAATDLYRDRSGSWRVLSHRAQVPSGMAYAIENRRVLARVFPALFRSAQVRRLGPFVQALRSAIEASAPDDVDSPTVVVLSPGSLSETAYEHGAIATRLGYPLVEGTDLRIRDGKVWLKTISDLVPVHVILRRVDAMFCDPLELRPDSTLGVPGLVDACRTGAVSVLNPLGAGVLENAGLLAILPRLCQALLGTDLLIPGVDAWWCGDDASRSHVLANLGSLVVRPLSRASLTHSIDTAQASRAELDRLRAAIISDPVGWVGQARAEPATSPVLAGDNLVPRATVLRTFAAAADGDYVVKPGGLARTAPGDDGQPIANRTGAISKDVWVLGPDARSAEEPAAIRIAGAAATVGSTAARAAENLFWLGRYAERAEATVRLLRVVQRRRAEVTAAASGPEADALSILLESATRITGTWPGFVGDDAQAILAAPDRELLALVVDRERPGTVAHAVDQLFNAMGVVRDQLSVDTWLVVGSLQRLVDASAIEAAPGPVIGDDDAVLSLLDRLLHGLLSLSGLATESMVRDQGWHFMDAGRRIERALHVTSLVGDVLSQRHDRAVESLLIESVAASTESIVTYRRRDRGQVGLAPLFELLLADAGNPRSLRFQVDRLSDDLAFLRASLPTGSTLSATPQVLEVARRLQAVSPAELAAESAWGQRTELVDFAGTVRGLLARAADEIGNDYFVRQLPQRAVRTPIEAPGRSS